MITFRALQLAWVRERLVGKRFPMTNRKPDFLVADSNCQLPVFKGRGAQEELESLDVCVHLSGLEITKRDPEGCVCMRVFFLFEHLKCEREVESSEVF